MAILIPGQCFACGAAVSPDDRLCDRCRHGCAPVKPPRISKAGFLVIGLIVLGLGIAIAVAIPVVRSIRAARRERSAAASLKLIAAAQTEFRDHDRDRDGRRQYWVEDVAGLHIMLRREKLEELRRKRVMIRWGREFHMQLIPLEVARADQAPDPSTPTSDLYPEPIRAFSRSMPLQGYWFRSLVRGTDGSGYAVAAMPEAYGAGGRKVLLVDETGALRGRDFDGAVLRRGETPPVLAGPFSGERPGEAELGEWGPFE